MLREHNQPVDDARASVKKLVPSDSAASLTEELKFLDEKEKQEVTLEQARFLLRLCLAISHAKDSRDPTATAAVTAVRDADRKIEQLNARRENGQENFDGSPGASRDFLNREEIDDGNVGELVFEEFNGVRADIHEGVAGPEPHNNKFLLYASEPMQNFYLAFQAIVTINIHLVIDW